MKIHEKIKNELLARNWSIIELHNRIKEKFGKKSLTYEGLRKIVAGEGKVRVNSLFKISTAFGIHINELRKDTDQEEKVSVFIHNTKAIEEIINNKLNILTERIIIKKDGIMPVMVDTKRFGPPTKWCYVLMGQLIIKVETVNGWETHILSKDESLAFDSSQKHQFENTAKITTKAIIIQNPKLL